MPINMLVILAVAVLVLLAVVAFFMGGFDSGDFDAQTVTNRCCRPASANPELCQGQWGDGDWIEYHGDPAEVEVGGEEVRCADYVPSPSQCPACSI